MYRKAEILTRIELRQSTIKDWLNCPLMYRFRHIEKLKPAYRSPAAIHGSALHLAIHWWHQGQFDDNLETLYNAALQESLGRDQDVPIRWKEDETDDLDKMRVHAREILQGYTRSQENQQCEIIYSEAEFRVKVGSYRLSGTIDQLRRNSGGELDLIDLKSGAQRPGEIALAHDWQLSLYAYALRFGELKVKGQWLRPKIRVNRTVIYFLRAHEIYKRNSKYGKQGEQKGGPFIVAQKTPWDLIQFRHDLLNLIKMMTKDWPFPNPGACGFCAYQTVCGQRSLCHAASKLERVQADFAKLGMLNRTPQRR